MAIVVIIDFRNMTFSFWFVLLRLKNHATQKKECSALPNTPYTIELLRLLAYIFDAELTRYRASDIVASIILTAILDAHGVALDNELDNALGHRR